MTIQRLFAIAAITTVAACSTGTAPGDRADDNVAPETSREAALEDTVHIELGRERSIDRGGITIGFLARVSDSRCPAHAVCVWEGDASVRLAVRSGGEVRDTILHTRLEPTSLKINGYVVTVPGLLPYPGTVPEGSPEPTPAVLVKVVKG